MEGEEGWLDHLALASLYTFGPSDRTGLAFPARFNLGSGHHLQRLHPVPDQHFPGSERGRVGVERSALASRYGGRGCPRPPLNQVLQITHQPPLLKFCVPGWRAREILYYWLQKMIAVFSFCRQELRYNGSILQTITWKNLNI